MALNINDSYLIEYFEKNYSTQSENLPERLKGNQKKYKLE